MDDAAVAEIVQRAARTLAATSGMVVLTAEVIDARDLRVDPHSGWCEVGRIDDAFGRCWWTVLWHPENGEGRCVREFPRAKRGTLGETLPMEE